MSRILDSIKGPEGLWHLSLADQQCLAHEVRQELVSRVSNNGGHLASNLGVVELTIALHTAFRSPRDKIIWDVGHQSYVHKLLTGRRDSFATLRQMGGISGFPDPGESPHDVFVAGHASTSVSAALGMALARDLAGEDYQVVAVLGDGALTGGMAQEALNHVGHLGTHLIVVLNDNSMSISPSVGSLARYLNKARLDPRYHRLKSRAARVMARLPLGSRLWHLARAVKEGIKGWVLPTLLWEELGFTYIGPVDGHDLASLREALVQARSLKGKPIFLHVITTKGKGYELAEADPVRFHGVAPAGEKKEAITYTQAFAETLLSLMAQDQRLVAITAAMLDGTGLAPVAQRFPERVLDVGLCEQHAVTMAAGLASQGFIPVVAIYSTFLQRAFDQIVHDVCLQSLPVVFALDRAGLVGEDGKTHQGTLDISYLTCVPNLVVAAPADEVELRHLLYTAIRAGRPMALRYPRGAGLGLAWDGQLRELPLGKGEMKQDGKDVTIVALGSAVAPSLEAAYLLAQEGTEAAVMNARFAKPLDAALLAELARATGRVITVEENVLTGGFGSAVRALLQESRVPARVVSLGLPDAFIPHGSQAALRSRYGLDGPGIARRLRQAFPELASLPVAR